MRHGQMRHAPATATLLAVAVVSVVSGWLLSDKDSDSGLTSVTTSEMATIAPDPQPTSLQQISPGPVEECLNGAQPEGIGPAPVTPWATVEVGTASTAADGKTTYSVKVKAGKLTPEQLAQALQTACGVKAKAR